MKTVKKYEEINATLAYLFNKAMSENPELMEALPDDAVVIMQLKGYESFNDWAKEISLKRPMEKGQKVVYALFRLKPRLAPKQITPRRIVSSKVEDLELQPA